MNRASHDGGTARAGAVESTPRRDEDLARRVQDGDSTALKQLMEQNYRCCLRIAMRMMRNREDAEDQVHTAMLAAIERIHQFRHTSQFSSWLIQILVNECRMRFRERQRWKMFDPGGEVEWAAAAGNRGRVASAEKELMEQDLLCSIRHHMGRLPAVYREVLFLRYVEQLSVTEVANRLGVTVPTVKSRVFRAHNELRQRMRCTLQAAPSALS
jgi:RNA polymerase sigma-70 factor, ECF subfamily